MAATSMNSALHYLRALFAGRQAEGESDRYLLEKFVGQSDETAFAALLQRHGPMTMGVCMRILHDEHLAEDALQATFLVLALKASSIRKTASVASWLYGVALRLARKLKARTNRARQQPARPVAEPPSPTPTEASRREEKELLDDELERLPDKYRLPLLLCYFEGRTQEEAAAQLGWTVGQVKGLLDRGRERLRFRLLRRGVTLSAAALATLLGETAWARAVPPRLALPTLKAVMNLVSGNTLAECGASASVVTLAKGGLTMGTKKIVLILAVVILTGTIAVAAGTWAQKARNPGGAERDSGPDQFAVAQERDGQGKGVEKKDAEPDVEEAVIDRMIDILKDKNEKLANEKERKLARSPDADKEAFSACIGLAKRGGKAKRAAPEMIRYLEQLLPRGQNKFGQELVVSEWDEAKFEQLIRNISATGAESKEFIAALNRVITLPESRQLAQWHALHRAAGAALGKIGTKEAFEALIETRKSRKDKDSFGMAPLRIGAIVGLQQFATGKNNDLKAKAKVELQLLAETDADDRVKQAGRQALARVNNTGLLLEVDEIEFAGDKEETKSVRMTSGTAKTAAASQNAFGISGGGGKAVLKEGAVSVTSGNGTYYVTVTGKDSKDNDATFLLKVFVNYR